MNIVRPLGFFITLSAIALLLFLHPRNSLADDYYWTGVTGSWDDPSNWNPHGVPQNYFFVQDGVLVSVRANTYLTNATGSSATSFFTGNAYSNGEADIGSLQIYGTDAGTMSLSISDGNLNAGGITIGNNGVVNQTYGSIFSSGMRINAGGTYNLSNGVLLPHATTLLVDGAFNQTGGEVRTMDLFIVGQGGVYNLSGTGKVSYDYANSSVNAGGVFYQRGGTVSGPGMYVAGAYNMSAGELNSSGMGKPNLIDSGGTFNQSGGTVRMTGGYSGDTASLYVGYDRGGNRNDGTYNLSGGRLEAKGILVGGQFNYSGGELVLGQNINESWVKGTLTNNGTTNLSGMGTRTIDGDVVNNGTFKTTHTTAVYNGTFTNNGAYISDPATQYFTNLIIGDTGFIVGQYGDKFIISGDFINHSLMSSDWNTMQAYLAFSENDDNLHDFYLTGQDLGQTISAYDNNFSWGTMDLSGNSLNLFDGNDVAGGALYLREILGLDISGNLIVNISGMEGLNIYYLSQLKENEYLHGLAFNLTGGGHLMPVSTPEPVTMLLLASGLVGLVGLRRRFKT